MIKPDSIILETYNPQWKELAQSEIQQLQKILPPKSICTIEHIGSTALTDLPAKPVIDLMIGVENIDAAKMLIPLIEAHGYAYWQDNPKTDRLFFAKGLPEKGGNGRTHHIHIVETTHYEYFARPLFRDYLQTHPDIKNKYAQLKKILAQQYKDDREAYTTAKTDFINHYSQLAMIEAMKIMPFNSDDFSLMHHWFNMPHVQSYYSLRAWTIEDVKKKLTPYLADKSNVKGFIISLKNQPIAYLQYCALTYNLWPKQDFSEDIVQHGAGIDFFIGEPSFLYHRLGHKIITTFIQHVIWPNYEFCVADPDIRNIASIKALKKAGFVLHKAISAINPLNQPVTLQLMIINKQKL